MKIEKKVNRPKIIAKCCYKIKEYGLDLGQVLRNYMWLLENIQKRQYLMPK